MKKVFFSFIVAMVLVLVLCSAGPRESTNGKVVLDAIATRTSIRSYTSASVGADTVELLLRAAMAAPSALNRQPWSFVVINDRVHMDSLASQLPYAKMLRQAPLAIVVCGDSSISNKWWIEDCSAASQNLLLAAHAVGLGAVWTGAYPGMERVEAIRKALHLPARIMPLNVIVIGYPADSPQPKQKWDPAKVHWNVY